MFCFLRQKQTPPQKTYPPDIRIQLKIPLFPAQMYNILEDMEARHRALNWPCNTTNFKIPSSMSRKAVLDGEGI